MTLRMRGLFLSTISMLSLVVESIAGTDRPTEQCDQNGRCEAVICDIERISHADLTYEVWQRYYLDKKPVVLTGSSTATPFHRMSTLESMQKSMGEMEVSIITVSIFD